MHTQTAVSPALKYEAVQDKRNPSEWRVEAIDIKSGDVFVTVFSGPSAQDRANEYAAFKNR